MKPSSQAFTLRIFLPDGPDGIRIIEKGGWTGVGLVFPRALFPVAKQRHELEGAVCTS